MKIVYLIMAHWHERQFRRLFDVLWNPVDAFILHADAKSPAPVHRAVEELALARPNVEKLPSRRVTWGGFSQVQTELDAIARALALSEAWDFFINLSGQDYPLVSRARAVERLSVDGNRNFVELISLEREPISAAARFTHRIEERDDACVRTPLAQSPPPGFAVEFLGGFWHALRRPFCEWLMSDPLPGRLREWFKTVGHPDESFMQCAIMNSPFRDTVHPRHLRKMIWQPGSPHPETLRLENLDELLAADALFARKLDQDVDARILDALDQRIGF